MSIIIDGHNLIGKLPGIQLTDPDDEERMVELLGEFCRREGKRVWVFFDNAPPGYQGVRQHGPVRVHYVRAGTTADQAIRRKLAQLGKTAPNWTVVTSDREVQRAAREARARVMPAEEFAEWIFRSAREKRPEDRADRTLSSDEVQYWQDFFKKPPGKK